MKLMRLGALLGALALALTWFSGCGGTECGDGTTEDGDKCVADGELVTDDVCGAGTELVDGACVLAESGCADGTYLEDGSCVPEPEFCDEGTTWDAGQEQCVANSEITCGEGTEEDGETCVPNADVCDAGTAFDAASGQCIPAEEVCDEGTTFDPDAGRCTAEVTCQEGDVNLNGVCVRPIDELAANADVEESENNDPALGGTAEELSVKPVGETTVFAGTIDEPSDIDGEGDLDQDVDVFEFDADAGDWFALAVQSNGLPAPAFMVEGPNDYVRYSAVGLAADPARELALPFDGTYSVTVLPSLVMQSEGDLGPYGGADWGYVGSLEKIEAPAASDVDLVSDTISGSFGALSDNLFSVKGYSAGDTVTVVFKEVGADAEGLLQVWSSATDFEREVSLDAGSAQIEVPDSGTLLLLVDWKTATGADLDYLFSPVTGDVEPNDERTDATIVRNVDNPVIGQTHSMGDDPDFFELTVSNAGLYLVETDASDSCFELSLMDADGNVFSYEDGTTTLVGGVLEPGTYYIEASGWCGATDIAVDYTMAISEPNFSPTALDEGSNDTDADAQQLTLSDSLTIGGTITSADDEDWYAIDVGSDTDVVVTLEGIGHELGDPGLDLTVDILDGAGESLGEVDERIAVSAGTFYIKASGFTDEGYNSYSLGVDEVECGNGIVEPTEMCDDGNTDDGDSCTSTCQLGTPTVSVTNDTSSPLDESTPSATRVASVSGCTEPVWAVTVDVDITHTWRGDLLLELTSPDDTTVTLHNGGGGSADDIVGNYPETLTAEGPGSLADFVGDTGDGDWELSIEDTALGADDGTFNSFTVNLYCN